MAKIIKARRKRPTSMPTTARCSSWRCGRFSWQRESADCFTCSKKQLYRHINKELGSWLESLITRWQDLEDLIPKFDHVWGRQELCTDFIDAFRNRDLQEL